MMFLAMLLGYIVGILGTLADSVLAGVFVSEEAVAATGLVAPAIEVIYFFSCIMGVGIANKFSNYAGAFENEKAYRYSGMGLLVGIISGVILMLAMFLFEDAFFSFYSASPEIEAMAREYYTYTAFLALIYPVFWVVYYLVSVDGNSSLILTIDITLAVTNALFSCLLVTRLGVKGLALGSLLACLIGCVLLIPHFLSKRNSVKFKLCFHGKMFLDVLVSGSSYGMGMLYLAIIDLMMNRFVIVRYGDSFLAAYAIVNLVLDFGEVFMSGAEAGKPFICVGYGEKNPVALRNMLDRCLKYTLIVSGAFAVLLFAFAKYVPLAYGIETPEVYEAALYSVRILAASYIPIGIVYMWAAFLPQIGKPILGNFIGVMNELVGPIVFAIPFGILFGYHGLVWGFFLAPVVATILTGLIIVLKYGKKAFPYAVEEEDSDIFIHEFAADEKEIVALQSIVHEEMMGIGLDHSIMNKIELTIEEVMMIVKAKNAERKKILADCTIIANRDDVRLILRDNGKVFDLTKEATNLTSLRTYVAARLMETDKETMYMTTISFNRTSFVWERA